MCHTSRPLDPVLARKIYGCREGCFPPYFTPPPERLGGWVIMEFMDRGSNEDYCSPGDKVLPCSWPIGEACQGREGEMEGAWSSDVNN